MAVSSFRELIVWQKSIDLVTSIYQLTKKFPDCERFDLTSQIRRAVVSIPSNIAEGSKRGSRDDYRRFLNIAFGSGGEVETQLEIAFRLRYMSIEDLKSASDRLTEIMKMLNAMLRQLKLQLRTYNPQPRT